MQVVALPIPVHRAANSRPTSELSPQAANRLTLIEQWEAMRGEGVTTPLPGLSPNSASHAASAEPPPNSNRKNTK